MSGPPHRASRSQDNPTYPQRFQVADDKVSWSTPFPGYSPTPYSHMRADASWADPADPRSIPDLSSRFTYEGSVKLDPRSGAPMNPGGRTGMCERGRLGKWGPNHAADPIVTRAHPTTGELQLVVIKRKDTGTWALPGGMVDPGEQVTTTVRREFAEEAGALQDPAQAARFKELTDELFGAGGQVVYTGYVDDPRNTDNAWMETAAIHFHCNEELGALLPLEAGDDAGQVKWVTIDDKLKMYASHQDWVDIVAANMRRRQMLGNIKRAATIALPLLVIAAGVVMARRK